MRRQTLRVFCCGFLPLCLLGLFCIGCTSMMSGLPVGDPMDGSTPDDGIREALRIGTSRAVQHLGKEDGFLKTEGVRILLPEKLDGLARGLRAIGADRLVDEFEVSMNRAAEAAVPLAKREFIKAIRQMTFADAMVIIRGNHHEATDFLRSHAGPALSKAFQPIVAEKLDAVGVTRRFDDLMDQASKLPFLRIPDIDLEAYVTGEAINGLFVMIGREEERIRRDPIARTTELLRKYFG